MRKWFAGILFAVFVVLSTVAISGPRTSAYTPHAPISITGNGDFTPQNGVVGGTGTVSDPYVIEGWEIQASTGLSVHILSTDAFFVIRNVYLHSTFASGSEMYFDSVSNGRVENSTIFTQSLGSIEVWYSENLTIAGNILNGNDGPAVHLIASRNITVMANDMAQTSWGLVLSSSTGVTVQNNTFAGNGITIWGDTLEAFRSHEITPDNLVNGKPLLFVKDGTGSLLDGLSIGQLIVANASSIRASNLVIENSASGVLLAFVDGAVVTNVLSGNHTFDGISIVHSNNVTIQRIVANDNGELGIRLEESSNVSLSDSKVFRNPLAGVNVFHDDHVVVTNSEISSNAVGVQIDQASNVTLAQNYVRFNTEEAVNALYSSELTIEDNDLSYSFRGLLIGGVSNVIVRQNTMSSNQEHGLLVAGLTPAVAVYHNNFLDNPLQGFDFEPHEWDDGYPNGGNYWSDYTGMDDCSGPNQDVCPDPDGIGDTPYSVPELASDRYPLMNPFATTNSPPLPPVVLPAVLSGMSLQDVTVAWLPSPDDGAGANDVVRYEIWSGMNYDRGAENYTLLAVAPAGVTSYTHAGAGRGDPLPHFYSIVAVDADEHTKPAEEQAAKFVRFLGAGFHLLSVPIEQADWSVKSVFDSLPWTQMRTFVAPKAGGTGWSTNDRLKGTTTFASLHSGMAVWIEMATAANWYLAGLVKASTEIDLQVGWNLVGYPSVLSQSGHTVFLSAPGPRWIEACADVPPYYLRRQTLDEVFVPGQGYWIYADWDSTITVRN